jgi:hypothetical protein
MSRKPVSTRAPEEFLDLKIKPPKENAAGAAAVFIAGKKVSQQAGVVRGGKALLKLNQVNGVDCPGCAWPDPDDERSSLGRRTIRARDSVRSCREAS